MSSTPTKADVKPPTQADLVRLTGLEALARLPVEIMRAGGGQAATPPGSYLATKVGPWADTTWSSTATAPY
jgi:hypothetical protein